MSFMNDNQDSRPPWPRVLQAPYLVFADDLAQLLRVPLERASTALRLGLLGPSVQVQGQPCILRADLEANLRLCSSQVREEDRELIRTPQGAGGAQK